MERTSTGKDRGKTGVFTGSYATHPISGDQVPVYIADYVLGNYGTGAGELLLLLFFIMLFLLLLLILYDLNNYRNNNINIAIYYF